jgi:hypothetical protein
MKTDGIERPDMGTSLEGRLQAAEQLCDVLRRRVDVLERERETLRERLEGILSLLDAIAG